MKTATKHWYPRAQAGQQPTPWWYYGRAIYVSRHDYRKIFFNFLAVGIPLGVTGLLLEEPWFLYPAYGLACIGFALLFYSLFGLYRQYGHPANNYFKKLLDKADVKGEIQLADIHIGTYRHTYQFSNHLPEAIIHSIDCWENDCPSEEAISDVRALEPVPTHEPRIKTHKAHNYTIDMPDASMDVVVFGFGSHEIPVGDQRNKIFEEARRILKPGGKLLMFEHGIDFENYLIFGPVIYHVTKHKEWMEFIRNRFNDVKEDRLYAVDMITAKK